MMPQGMEGEYNTPLGPEEERRFQAWAKRNNRLRDLYDYDIRGWWKQNGQENPQGHLTDRFKKPNHPTFSNESMYSGEGSLLGGSWSKLPNGQDAFSPGPANFRYWDSLDMQKWFDQFNPEVRLMMEGSM